MGRVAERPDAVVTMVGSEALVAKLVMAKRAWREMVS